LDTENQPEITQNGTTEAPGEASGPDMTPHNPVVQPSVIDRAAAALAASQAERKPEGAEPAQEAPAADAAQAAAEASPAQEAQAGAAEPGAEPQPLTRTEYYEHLDRLEAENRALRSRQAPNFEEMSLEQRFQAAGIDPASPEAVDFLVDAWGQPGALADQDGGFGQPQQVQQSQQPPLLPEGTDPAVMQMFQQQQQAFQQQQHALAQVTQQLEQLGQGIQQRDKKQAEADELDAKVAQFNNVRAETPDEWPIYNRALERGLSTEGFQVAVADEMVRRTGVPPSFGEVLDTIESFMKTESEKAAGLLTPQQAQQEQKQQPTQPATPPAASESTTLAEGDAELAPTRRPSEEERLDRAARVVMDRQKERALKNKR